LGIDNDKYLRVFFSQRPTNGRNAENSMDKQTTARPGWAAWPAHPAEKCGTYALNERARITADLKRNADKNSGALAQREVDRAHELDVKAGVVA
jgi:hypothetical protein